MPYFIYRISQPKRLKYLEEYPSFGEARTRVHTLRAEETPGSTDLLKIIFAKSAAEAERLLMIEREAPPMGEELG